MQNHEVEMRRPRSQPLSIASTLRICKDSETFFQSTSYRCLSERGVVDDSICDNIIEADCVRKYTCTVGVGNGIYFLPMNLDLKPKNHLHIQDNNRVMTDKMSSTFAAFTTMLHFFGTYVYIEDSIPWTTYRWNPLLFCCSSFQCFCLK